MTRADGYYFETKAAMRLTITAKIILGVTLILVIGGGTMATIFIALNAIEKSLHEVSEVEEPTSAAAYEMEITVVNMGLGTVNYLNTGAPRSRQIVEKVALIFTDSRRSTTGWPKPSVAKSSEIKSQSCFRNTTPWWRT